MNLSIFGRLIVPVVLALTVTGCLKFKQQQAQSTAPEQKVNVLGPLPGVKAKIDAIKLQQLALCYLSAADANGRPPANVDELGIKRDDPQMYQAIVDGHIIVYWKASITNAPQGPSNTILAYDADVPTKGGAVAMLDATARRMTAEEFKTAAKAGQ
jgi:hypothetical protein